MNQPCTAPYAAGFMTGVPAAVSAQETSVEAANTVSGVLRSRFPVISRFLASTASRPARPRRPQRPLQVIHSLAMVNDHVLRDVGLDRSAIAVLGQLSADGIETCRSHRAAA